MGKFLPEYRDSRIQLHHLLAQTSGVAEITDTAEFRDLKKQTFTSLDPLIQLIASLKPNFPPGSRWAYSNSNFLLLAKVVEVVSHESWWTFVKRELIDRAGIKETWFAFERGSALVSGHDFDPDYALIAIADIAYRERGWANGAGGIESTAQDLARWNSALYGGQLLSQSSLALMTTRHGQVDRSTAYGYGLFITSDEVTGETYYYHPGGIPGFISYNSFYPDRKLSTVALANYAAIEPIDFAHALSRLEVGGSANLQAYIDDPTVPPFALDGYAGTFSSADSPTGFELLFENGKLYAASKDQAPHRLVIRGEGRFYDRSLGAELKFSKDSKDEFDLQGEGGSMRFYRTRTSRLIKTAKRVLTRGHP